MAKGRENSGDETEDEGKPGDGIGPQIEPDTAAGAEIDPPVGLLHDAFAKEYGSPFAGDAGVNPGRAEGGEGEQGEGGGRQGEPGGGIEGHRAGDLACWARA